MLIQDALRNSINAYVSARSPLAEVEGKVATYDWSVPTSELEQSIVSVLALYIEEISEGLRSEEDLRERLRSYELSPTFSPPSEVPIALGVSSAKVFQRALKYIYPRSADSGYTEASNRTIAPYVTSPI